MKANTDQLLRPIIRAIVATFAAACFLNACSTLDASGSGHAKPRMTQAERWKAAGFLQVFSEQVWERKAEGGPSSFLHSEYKVLSPEGHFVMQVQNGGPLEGPSVVRMEPGKYVVVAQAYKRGTVRLPVTIETGRTIVLHLDQEGHGGLP